MIEYVEKCKSIAGQNQDKALALVLVSPGGTPLSQPDLDTLLSHFDMTNWANARAFMDLCLGGPPRWRFDLWWGIRARVAHPSIKALLADMSPEDLLVPAELSALQMPILLYWGQDDGILTAPHQEFYATHLPSSRVIHTPAGMGHAPFLDNVKTFLAVVVAFCERLPQSAYSVDSNHK